MELSKEVIEMIKTDIPLLDNIMEDAKTWAKLNSKLDNPLIFSVIMGGVKIGVQFTLNNPTILKSAKLYTQEEVDKIDEESYRDGWEACAESM